MFGSLFPSIENANPSFSDGLKYGFQLFLLGEMNQTNIAPENGWLGDEMSFWDGLSSGAMLVSGRVIFVQGVEITN